MRILQLHSNYIEYKPIKKEIKLAEESEKKIQRIEEVLVLFVAIEKNDDDTVAIQAIGEIKDFLNNLGSNKIIIYPYAHLSSNLANPRLALKIIKNMEQIAKKEHIETYRAPFGWNKQLTISIKGHPLAEQSREIAPSKHVKHEKISQALKDEEKRVSSWFILNHNGIMLPVNEFNFARHQNLEKFSQYEIKKMRESHQAPPHVKLMKKLELVDYEPGSDPGNLRWYPKGRLIKSLIEQFVTATMLEYGAMEVETPVMYDYDHPSLSNYLNRFPARQYIVKSEDKDLFLRFAACFGQFLMLHDTQFSYRQLPLRIYELTKYSFRREKSGEVSGLRRQRAFTMPDCHALCADLEQVKKEFIVRFKLCMKVLKEIGFEKDDYELGIRFTKDFYNRNKHFISSLVKLFRKPVLVETFKEKVLYWILKWEFNFIDNQNKASALSTDQIDVENAERYDISYVDEKGEKQRPMILHCSPSGGIERCIYALLEKAYREQQNGKVPLIPLWLSPTQVRIIPVSDKYEKEAVSIVERVKQHKIRVDLDDRQLTMQKKIRAAETEWINYVVVIGQKEITSGILPIRDRFTGKISEMEIQEFIAKILKETDGRPFKRLPLPMRLSERPQFYG